MQKMGDLKKRFESADVNMHLCAAKYFNFIFCRIILNLSITHDFV